MGFDARWGVLGAADVGANHQRDRIWIVGKMGNANNNGQTATKVTASIAQGSNTSEAWSEQASQFTRPSEQYAELAYTSEIGLRCEKTKQRVERELRLAKCGVDRKWWTREPEFVPRTTQREMGGMVDGMASRVDEIKALGNGQVPLCAATAWRILSELF
jgi:DNA (cytosine-5)-methyltransferase 1